MTQLKFVSEIKFVEVRVAELKEFTRKEDADKMYEMISETRITEEVE
ncbi:hypothetical protein ICE98_02120 [Lactococcus lactis]|nr:hypothetical protein [Lactococcus lactis]